MELAGSRPRESVGDFGFGGGFQIASNTIDWQQKTSQRRTYDTKRSNLHGTRPRTPEARNHFRPRFYLRRNRHQIAGEDGGGKASRQETAAQKDNAAYRSSHLWIMQGHTRASIRSYRSHRYGPPAPRTNARLPRRLRLGRSNRSIACPSASRSPSPTGFPLEKRPTRFAP